MVRRGEEAKKTDLRVEKLDRELSRMGIRIRDTDQRKVRDEVFDEVTLHALYKLANKKEFTALGGSISTGKEANVFIAEREGGIDCVIKIYRIRTGNFNAMSEYILGDPRFASIRKTKKEIIFAWTRKEYANLSRAHEAGIFVPEPITFDRNILIMEFLGREGVPYPQLRLAPPGDAEAAYTEILNIITDLYQKARLIHGDLSEYNILHGDGRLWLIDMGQAVTPEHPSAHRFLFRDIKNINRYFGNRCKIQDEHEILRGIVGEDFFTP
ncbi:MAG: serine protein kinase RIO [Methanocalculus sp. MSAO_Arc1]|uniref:serine protein kinase RIO n=1 Tax=Methanocalculus TaxID=71151 RepID=UPI000FF2D09B|nr:MULTISPECIES: serine protein kinase RIO [unclassified Methanocalculus]MCP1661650.1 RIO kinase 1 [Methanocalculus sp. AMF5]RQD81913.1 MAG: serine protein kinase RIO [Methanocalculus sp. MSAO_Arc1]